MEPKLVLVIPPCEWCSKDAEVDVMTIYNVRAALCDGCALTLAKPRTGRKPLAAAAGIDLTMTAAEAAAYLDSQTWVYAKSMPKTPHEYVLLRRSTAPWDHLRASAYIRAHGEARPWRWPPAIHHYWQPGDGWEYWTLRQSDTILNRRKVSDDDQH